MFQISRVSRESVWFKAWSRATLQHAIIWSIKTNFNNKYNHDAKLHLFFCLSCHDPLLSFFSGGYPRLALLLYYWLCSISSITCSCFSSLKHSAQTPVSFQEMISLYLIMVSLMAFWRSSLNVKFRRGLFNWFEM